MDTSAFFSSGWGLQNPLLPGPTAMRVALYLIWAIVLGSGAMLIAANSLRSRRWWVGVVVLLWTLVGGEASPAYWLGLAFQTPSLMSAAICLNWLLDGAGSAARPQAQPTVSHRLTRSISVGFGIFLGWILLLDTLAMLPVSVYAWGFGSGAVGVMLVAAGLWWAYGGAGGNQFARVRWFAGPLWVLALFVLIRLPTGNVWDALIDPWLWLALQIGWFNGVVRRPLARWRVRRATIRA